MTYALLTAAAIVFCIFLEWKWHINMGLSAAVIAFLIGCFGLGLSPGDLKNMLPIKIIFPITAITTFYGFALDNGTLLKVVQHVIYRFRSRPGAIPVMLFCLCVLLGIAGMDAGSITAIMAPIAMSIAALGDQPVLPYAVTTLLAAAVGSNYMFATGGAIMRGLIEETVFSESAFGISLSIFLYNLLCYAVLFLITIFLFRNRGERPDVAKPEPLERRQKINLIMIGLFVVAVALPSILSEVTGSNVLKALAKNADVGFIALVFALAATLFRLGDINTIIKTRVPWKTLFMVSGITVLIGVASKAGMTDALADLVGSNCPGWLVVPLVTLIAGIMSVFSSAISVVIPTMFPMVPSLAATTGIAASPFYLAIAIGASTSALSPFSTGGSIMLGNCTDEAKREKLMFGQIVSAFAMLACVIIYCGVIALFY
jgi:di/tricarboxylate transporter